MTVQEAVQRVRRRPQRGDTPFLVVVVLVTVACRLLLAHRPATPDEGGFLVVASQWHVGGSSLYGNYWVDRPPLLIGIFRLADLAGGLVALRVIGALLAAATLVLLADTARRAFGIRAARWTAVAAAALLVSPLAGTQAVNGELLALPFLALGLRLAVEAVRATDPLSARGAALGTGVAAVLALLVKQNMADVVVFALVCWLVAWRTGRLTGRSCRDLFALAVVGGGLGYAVVMLWAMAHGTSPLGVYEATYPFRVHAGRVLVATASERTDIRLNRLGTAAVLSGVVPVLLGFVLLAVRRARATPEVWAIVAASVFAAASIVSGGSYWLHYLVQALPVTALAIGALASVRRPSTRLVVPLLVSGVVVSAVASLVTVVTHEQANPGAVVARSLEGAAQSGDTMVSAFGDGDIVEETGMSSPYPYLWSLPTRTLDPDLTLMRGVLAGPGAPTWFIVRGRHTMGILQAHGVGSLLDDRYRPVGIVCSRYVYLRQGVDRPPLSPHGSCDGLVLP
ncbi:MAG: glycosyltransferase family 39 protein [Propionibacteriales bacterium]|nr:glycosyltransferase family 39 protein [Propionibacteriales bacterium]